ncbi:PilZ domain-containing protein [Paludibaculum fermentans]|uniref:PilZ domain-containing protein n=1 Tax=Paludibaculum fermentans TaxID=1473598 RepID=UPI003EBA9C52
MGSLPNQVESSHRLISTSTPGERRASRRFQFVQNLVFQRKNARNMEPPLPGVTLNMSSTGILFETSAPLMPGETVRMAIQWPAQLDRRCAMKILVVARVVRRSQDQVAVEMLQHSFKTSGKSGLSL